jgi:hypothetical protein
MHDPRRSTRGRRAWVVVAAVALLAGCGESGSSSDGIVPPVDEIAAHDGQVCPRRLPPNRDPGSGIGTGTPAASAPSLPDPDAAWLCRYTPGWSGSEKDEDNARDTWVRTGRSHPVGPAHLSVLARALTGLEPAEADQLCTADLGPRWMLVLSHENDLTGVVVDDFGCRNVRLTADPFEVAAGDATSGAVVAGVLTGPDGLLDDLKAAAGP